VYKKPNFHSKQNTNKTIPNKNKIPKMNELITKIKDDQNRENSFEAWIESNTTENQKKLISNEECMENLKRIYNGEYWVSLYPYQKKVLEKMKHWKHQSIDHGSVIKGGLISCEMGLGKTLMSLSFLEWNRGKMNMIICEKSTISTWIEEIQKHYDGVLNMIVLHSSYTNCAETITIQTIRELKADVVIVPFEYLISKFDLSKRCLKIRKKGCREMIPDLYSYRDIDKMDDPGSYIVEGSVKINTPESQNKKYQSLYDIEWDLIIMDETTRIMKMTSNAFISSSALCSKLFLALSGTPILNYSRDLCSVFQFLGCPFMRSKEWNKSVFEKMKLGDHMVRLSYDDISDNGTQFKKPPKPTFITCKLELDDDQHFLQREICEMFEHSGKNKNTLCLFVYALKMCISKTLMNSDLLGLLVQFKKSKMDWKEEFFTFAQNDKDDRMIDYDSDETVTEEDSEAYECHIKNVDALNTYANLLKQFYEGDIHCNASPKYKKCVEICLSRKNEGTLVFSKYAEPLEQLYNIMKGYSDLKVQFINGNTKSKDRTMIIKKCNDRKVNVLLMTYDIGACSLNISQMKTIVLLDSAFNFSTESQAVARCYRMGQTESVQVHKMIMKNTLEEHILNLQQKKEDDKNDFMGDINFDDKSKKTNQNVFGDYVKHFLSTSDYFLKE